MEMVVTLAGLKGLFILVSMLNEICNYSGCLVHGSRFKVSRFALFSIVIILCIAEYISLTEHGEHREETFDYFLNFVISVRYNLFLPDNTFSESIRACLCDGRQVPLTRPQYLSRQGGIQSLSLSNREP